MRGRWRRQLHGDASHAVVAAALPLCVQRGGGEEASLTGAGRCRGAAQRVALQLPRMRSTRWRTRTGRVGGAGMTVVVTWCSTCTPPHPTEGRQSRGEPEGQ